MNDYEFTLYLEKLIAYQRDRIQNYYFKDTDEMQRAQKERLVKLLNVLHVHMENGIGRAILRGRP